MSCTCQDCGKQYNIDLIIPNEYWEKITPKKGGGLLCGSCIMLKLEKLIGEPDYYYLIKNKIALINKIKDMTEIHSYSLSELSKDQDFKEVIIDVNKKISI